jgi:GST-like protein
LLYDAGDFPAVYKNAQRWTDAIANGPAVQRGRMVNRTRRGLSSQLHESMTPAISKPGTQDELEDGKTTTGG